MYPLGARVVPEIRRAERGRDPSRSWPAIGTGRCANRPSLWGNVSDRMHQICGCGSAGIGCAHRCRSAYGRVRQASIIIMKQFWERTVRAAFLLARGSRVAGGLQSILPSTTGRLEILAVGIGSRSCRRVRRQGFCAATGLMAAANLLHPGRSGAPRWTTRPEGSQGSR
jgi:hypothetical protein